jgi:hypothetical protein
MFSDEIVSCYKDPAELGLFHDVQMKGIPAGGSFYSLPNKTNESETSLRHRSTLASPGVIHGIKVAAEHFI